MGHQNSLLDPPHTPNSFNNPMAKLVFSFVVTFSKNLVGGQQI